MTHLLFGATGQVGSAVLQALLAADPAAEITLLNRRHVPIHDANPRLRQVVLDPSAPDFEERVADLASGHQTATSCVGIGKGTATIPEADLMRTEVDAVGAYARGCRAAGVPKFALLLAVGIKESQVNSRVKAVRVMAKKLQTVLDVGYDQLAVFQPGTIVGNKNTPGWAAWLGNLIPDSWGYGSIHQETIGRAFAAYLTREQPAGTQRYGNVEIKRLAGAE